MKEHIRLLEDRVKELVSQNFKLVQRLTQAEETNVNAELRQELRELEKKRPGSDQLDGLLTSPEETREVQFKTAKQPVPNKIETAAYSKSTSVPNSRVLPPSSAKAMTQPSKLRAPSKFTTVGNHETFGGAAVNQSE